MKRWLIAGVVGALVVSAAWYLSACWGTSATSTGTGWTQVATYLYVKQPLSDWDPAIECSDGAITLMNVYETLLLYDDQTKSFTPCLATDYSRNKDATKWIFHLRHGVKFHDGSTMD